MDPVNRKLTTVLSADVQGFSRLMEADEEGTFATLKSYRDSMARLVASHGGRVVNTWGDGVIAEFPSVVAAVRSAVDVQTDLAQRNASRTDSSPMFFRIGINLGDVIVDGDDIYGDGVNIAARLQAEAPPGGILISRTVHDQVRNKLSVGFEFLGNLSVKNIDEAIPSYIVRVGEPLDRPNMPQPAPSSARTPFAIAGFQIDRKIVTFGVAGIALVVINLAASPTVFWARWPLLAFAVVIGFDWARRTTRFDRMTAGMAVAALGVTAINLFAWNGEFWAIWPLLVFAVVAALWRVSKLYARPKGRRQG